jgi:hypothetical protein
MGVVPLHLLRLLSIEHFDRAAVGTFGHLLERWELVVGQYPFELSPGVFDQLTKLAVRW